MFVKLGHLPSVLATAPRRLPAQANTGHVLHALMLGELQERCWKQREEEPQLTGSLTPKVCSHLSTPYLRREIKYSCPGTSYPATSHFPALTLL